MPSYMITGLAKAEISNDRSQAHIEFGTTTGPATINVSMQHVRQLISTLEGLISIASMHRPAEGLMPGEQVEANLEVVDGYQIGHGSVNGVSSVCLGLKTGPVFRWFALNAEHAQGIQQLVAVEIPKLRDAPASH